jgi:hypothetical protein
MIIHEPIMGKYHIDVEYKNFILFEYSKTLKVDKKTGVTYRKKIIHGHFGDSLSTTLTAMATMMIRDRYSPTRMITIKNYVTELKEIKQQLKETINEPNKSGT